MRELKVADNFSIPEIFSLIMELNCLQFQDMKSALILWLHAISATELHQDMDIYEYACNFAAYHMQNGCVWERSIAGNSFLQRA